MKAGNHGDTASKHASLEQRFIHAAGVPRLPAKALDEILDAQDDNLAELVFPNEIQSCHRFAPDFVERVSARHEIGETMLTGIACIDHLTGFLRRSSGRFETGQSIFNWTRPQNSHLHQEVRACPRGRVSMPLGHRD
ncbi:MAG TPA: hypothetical protein VK720_07070 [Terracidiphilus sp.]|nr:hypothetical protein [Terracidiphilus sp.]